MKSPQGSDIDQCMWNTQQGQNILYFPLYLLIAALVGFMPDLIVRLKFVAKYVFLFKLGKPSKKKKRNVTNVTWGGGKMLH